MPHESRTLKPWEPSPEQVYASRYLAYMKTWKETAAAVGVDIATIGRWLRIPEFRDMVMHKTAEIEHDLNQELMAGAVEILHAWREMTTGQVNSKDKRFEHNAPIVRDFYQRAITFGDAPPSDAVRSPGLAVQFNITGGERIEPPTDVTPEA